MAGRNHRPSKSTQNFAELPQGESRDIAAKAVGMARRIEEALAGRRGSNQYKRKEDCQNFDTPPAGRSDAIAAKAVGLNRRIEEALGNRQGQRTDLKPKEELPQNFAEVKPGTESRDIAAKAVGMNRETYRQEWHGSPGKGNDGNGNQPGLGHSPRGDTEKRGNRYLWEER